MNEPLWRRVRRQAKADGERDDDPTEPSQPTGSSAEGSPGLGGLVDLDDSGDKRAAYADWAERMRAKRDQKRDAVRQLASDDTASSRPSYWSPDFVWEESRRLVEEGTAVVSRADHLAVLGLGADATDAEIVASYRRQAKEHHPDRFPDADEATIEHHAEQMQRLTTAYRALQQPGSAS